ncbi:uncharacterized protein LOC142903774 [Nelusetta ayraudi]|uniref:uncharacterized protein LOC142903774 n=1 Tax=Nelusetta ayraudi TaxID=303726 RepID=UPI003F6E8B91
MDGEEATQTADPDQPEEEQQQSAEEAKPAETRSEWDTDLEPDNNNQPHLSRAELYQEACQHTKAVPVKSFFRNLENTHMNLNHYGLGPLGAKALAIALRNDGIITNLELDSNALRAEGARYIMEMLKTNTTIESLNLSRNKLHLEGAKIVCNMLICNYFVKSIKLSGNHFYDATAKHFADALRGDAALQELDLSYNCFSEGAGVHLAPMIARNVGLEVLNLSWNHIKGGAVALSAGLRENLSIKKLLLAQNGFGRIEAEALGQAIKSNGTIEELDLSHNYIDDEATSLLCQGLVQNNTMRIIKLSRNPMTHVGALTLLKTYKRNASAIEQIDISSVLVREAFMQQLAKFRPGVKVRYTVLNSVSRNLVAFKIFKKFLDDNSQTVKDFFKAMDTEGKKEVPTSVFRKALKDASVPLDVRQIQWMIRKLDRNFTSIIKYSEFSKIK